MLIIKYLFLVLFSITLISCDETPGMKGKPGANIQLGTTPDQTGQTVKVHFIDSSFTKAILEAGRTRIYQDRMETLLDGGVRVDFFSKTSGKRASRLNSDSAVIDDKTRNMIAKGHVIVVGDSSGVVVKTSIMHWDNATRKLYSTAFVEIDRPGEHLQGYGFESDQNLINYKIFKVSGVQK